MENLGLAKVSDQLKPLPVSSLSPPAVTQSRRVDPLPETKAVSLKPLPVGTQSVVPLTVSSLPSPQKSQTLRTAAEPERQRTEALKITPVAPPAAIRSLTLSTPSVPATNRLTLNGPPEAKIQPNPQLRSDSAPLNKPLKAERRVVTIKDL